MPHQSSHPDLMDRFLRLLEFDVRKPSVKALSDVVAAFMMHVPFENISKLYYKKLHGLRGIPDFGTYLDGIERYHFGGTCYANAHYANLLLRRLGYDAKLCGADMSDPDVHLVNMVTLDGREFLVDVGFAAPFLAPLPRDLKQDHSVVLGRDRYVLKPKDEQGNSRMELYRDGKFEHGYVVKPLARSIDYFTEAISDSFRETAEFMNILLMVRWYRNRSVTIHNLTVIESEGTETRKCRLADQSELADAVQSHFGIPKEITWEAVSQIPDSPEPVD